MKLHTKLYLKSIVFLVILVHGCAKDNIRLNKPSIIKQPSTAQFRTHRVKSLAPNRIELPDTLTLNNNQPVTVYVQKSPQGSWFKDIFPVITLLLGIAINKSLDYFSDRKKITKAGKRWHAELLSLEKPLTEQIKNLETALLAHNTNPMQSPRIISNAQLDGESFDSLDKSELLAYINRYYKKNFQDAIELSNRINFFVSITKSNKESLKKRYEEFVENYGKRHEKFNANLQELYKSLHTYSHEIKNNEGEDALNGPRFKPLDDLFREHISPFLHDGKLNYLELDKVFLIPLLKELEKLSADHKVIPLMNFARNCLDNIKGIKMENDYFSTNLQTIIDFFKEDYQKLKKILADISIGKKRNLHIF